MDTAVVSFDPDAIIDRIASGTLTRTIAAELGCGRSTLQQRLVKHPRYAEAISAQAESLVEKATEELMSEELPAESAAIARARARVDAAHKWAAARDPAAWAPRPTNIVINNNVLSISDSLVGQAGELLSQLRVCNTAPAIASQQTVDNDQE